jgi:hypothetical protein
VAGEGLLDLLGDPVATVGEPVEFFGKLATDPAGDLLGRDGDGLDRELDGAPSLGGRPCSPALETQFGALASQLTAISARARAFSGRC